jgi:hypothetical protein
MDITAIFRGDRFRLACGIAPWIPENARDIGDKGCPARTLRRADCRGSAIVAVAGHNGVATQDEVQMDIATIFRGDHCRVVSRKTCENPWDFSNNARDKKKVSRVWPGVWPPSGAKSLAKRGFSIAEVVQNAPIRATKQRQTRPNGRSIRGSGRKTAPGAAFRHRSKGTRLPSTSELLAPTRRLSGIRAQEFPLACLCAASPRQRPARSVS